MLNDDEVKAFISLVYGMSMTQLTVASQVLQEYGDILVKMEQDSFKKVVEDMRKKSADKLLNDTLNDYNTPDEEGGDEE